MAKLIKINRQEAIKVMENNLKIIKECNDSDTFLLLSSDLETEKFIGKTRINRNGGVKLMKRSKTFVLSEDSEEDTVSVLSMYTAIQKDIYSIKPVGKKHDIILIPQFE